MSASEQEANSNKSPTCPEYDARDQSLTQQSPTFGASEQSLPVTNEFNEIFNLDWSSTARNSQHQTNASKFTDLDLIMANPASKANFGFPSPASNIGLQDDTSGMNGAMQFKENLENSGIRQSNSSPAPWIAGSSPLLGLEKCKDFDNVLEHCTEMHKDIEETFKDLSRSPPVRGTPKDDQASKRIYSTLDRIDRACNYMFGLYCQTTSTNGKIITDHATVALTLALTSKIFQACNIMLCHKSLRDYGLNGVLGRKRLDMNLTQAKMVTSKLTEMTHNGALFSEKLVLDATDAEDTLKAIT